MMLQHTRTIPNAQRYLCTLCLPPGLASGCEPLTYQETRATQIAADAAALHVCALQGIHHDIAVL